MSRFTVLWRCALLCCAVTVAVSAQAQTCASLSAYLEDIRANYRDIDADTELVKAREAIKAVRAGLVSAATAAQDCHCQSVYTELMSSSAFARQAEVAQTSKDFMYDFNRSILSYNTAVDMLNHCPH